MRALDTNILIRFFVDDDSSQAAAARRVLNASIERREPLWISTHVLCELVWVLNTSFQLTKAEVVDILQLILAGDLFVFERHLTIQRALDSYRQGPADFPDYIIGEIAAAAGCRDTVTFDKSLKGSRGFTLL